jgi:hypothetical protein
MTDQEMADIIAVVETADTASTQRLKAVAARLPGGDSENYIAVLCDFFAHEYKWKLEDIAGMDSTQMILFVEQALKRRAHIHPDAGPKIGVAAKTAGASEGECSDRSSKRRTGRPKSTEKDSATKVIAALAAHHGYEENGSVTNYEQATNRGLADEYGLAANALSRFLAAKLGEDGHEKYAIACRQRTIGTWLALWRREMPGRLADLLPEEYGRGEDD